MEDIRNGETASFRSLPVSTCCNSFRSNSLGTPPDVDATAVTSRSHLKPAAFIIAVSYIREREPVQCTIVLFRLSSGLLNSVTKYGHTSTVLQVNLTEVMYVRSSCRDKRIEGRQNPVIVDVGLLTITLHPTHHNNTLAKSHRHELQTTSASV